MFDNDVDFPIHQYVPVNKKGRVATEEDEFMLYVCWCDSKINCPVLIPLGPVKVDPSLEESPGHKH